MRFTNIPFSTQMPDRRGGQISRHVQLPGAERVHSLPGGSGGHDVARQRVLVDHWDIDRATKKPRSWPRQQP